MTKQKTYRESILTTESWQKIKEETKTFLKEIGEMALFFLVLFYIIKLLGLTI